MCSENVEAKGQTNASFRCLFVATTCKLATISQVGWKTLCDQCQTFEDIMVMLPASSFGTSAYCTGCTVLKAKTPPSRLIHSAECNLPRAPSSSIVSNQSELVRNVAVGVVQTFRYCIMLSAKCWNCVLALEKSSSLVSEFLRRLQQKQCWCGQHQKSCVSSDDNFISPLLLVTPLLLPLQHSRICDLPNQSILDIRLCTARRFSFSALPTSSSFFEANRSAFAIL